jgi:tetratricopeptide (TPR) repeat protein
MALLSLARRLPSVVVALSLLGSAAHAESVTELTAHAMRECEDGQVAPTRDQRVAHFERGQKLAEQAVALDAKSAPAHFAVFCNLGEMLRVDGEKITSIMGFRKLMQELDRTLELDPNHLDALSSKGVLLIRLPTLLGGDVPQGEKVLERVVREDPGCITARITLAELYAERGARADAVALAAQARELARASGRADKFARADAALTKLKANPGEVTAGLAVTTCPGQPGVSCPAKITTAQAQAPTQ